VVPAFTVKVCGLKAKLSIDTALADTGCAHAGKTIAATTGAQTAPNPAAIRALRTVFEIDIVCSSSLQ
jgi:hypothetical protein